MDSLKCKSCGYYFDLTALNSCPRCIRGFSSIASEDVFASGNTFKVTQDKNGAMIFSLAGIVAIGLVVTLMNSSSSSTSDSYSYTSGSDTTSYSDNTSQADTNSDSYSDSTESWIPAGYLLPDVSTDVARNPDYQASGCTNEGSGYCWVFQIVTKYDCNEVTASLSLDNYGENIGVITGYTNGTIAGVPTLIEIDAYDNPDVNESTESTIMELSCSY